MNHPQHLGKVDILSAFPRDQYPQMRANQEEALEILQKQSGITILELPTGSGKTVIGYTYLKALEMAGLRSLFYIVPTKTLVEQIQQLHPQVITIFGRNEYPCYYYEETLNAEEAPCSMLQCPYRVDQESGQTLANGVEPCPYLYNKFRAKQGGIVACTAAFYLYNQLFNSNDWVTAQGLVVDEAHNMAKIVRSCLSYEISDFHLKRVVNLLGKIDMESAAIMEGFQSCMYSIIRCKPKGKSLLMEPWEIRQLMGILLRVNTGSLRQKLLDALKNHLIDPKEEHETLKRLEVIVHNLHRYLRSFEYSLDTEQRHALNYTYAFHEVPAEGQSQARLHIRAYYVAPLIQRIIPKNTLAYSATIGDADTFSFETGIKGAFYSFPCDFPAENTRIFLPKDTPNLALKSRSKRDLAKTLRRIAKLCYNASECGQRLLVVVVSEQERQRFLWFCQEEKVDATSYGNGITAKNAARRFKEGKGQVLVGTVANYGEGIDLPAQTASIIIFLRPGYPRPDDPATLFEEKRFGNMRWKLWNWRVMIEALQVRGRNVRSVNDLGVAIFISQQFRRFLFAVLPKWLQNAYKGDSTLEECLEETQKLLT